MKIIAHTENGMILQAEKQEVARLIGFHSAYRCEKQLAIGAEIQVNAMYDQLYKIRNLKHNIKLIEANAAELLESIRIKCPVIEPIVDAIEATAPKES